MRTLKRSTISVHKLLSTNFRPQTSVHKLPSIFVTSRYSLAVFILEDALSVQAPVVRKVDNASIHHYPAGSVVCFVNTYPLDSDLSEG